MMTAAAAEHLLPDFYAPAHGPVAADHRPAPAGDAAHRRGADPLLAAGSMRRRRAALTCGRSCSPQPLLAAAFHLVFRPPQSLDLGGQAAWLFFTLAAAYLGYSLAIVAYQAWGAELAHDDAGRARITGAREGAAADRRAAAGSLPRSWRATARPRRRWSHCWRSGWQRWRGARRGRRRRGHCRLATPTWPSCALQRATRAWLLGVFALNALAPSNHRHRVPVLRLDRLGLAAYAPMFLAAYFLAGAAKHAAVDASGAPLQPARAVARRHGGGGWWHCVWPGGCRSGAPPASRRSACCPGWPSVPTCALPPALLARRDRTPTATNGQREGAYFGLWNFAKQAGAGGGRRSALAILDRTGLRAWRARGPWRSMRWPSPTRWCPAAEARRRRPARRRLARPAILRNRKCSSEC